MDLHGIRSLNLVGTIFFLIVGTLLPSAYYQPGLFVSGSFCMSIFIIWIAVVFIIGILLYRNTVLALDKKDFDTVRTWTLIGVLFGFAGGIIPFLLFIVSYASLEGVIEKHYVDKVMVNTYKRRNKVIFCESCDREIPDDSNLCPYCGDKQSPMRPYKRTRPITTN